ncbi:Peptidase S33 tripeptidyl aminopeptidase-lik [Fusarium albosuccineum]|uniref:Peptidase S33 tripeptidyl aminopeptidase-lik n=1 Tax=Fusarium albosuccineum TaxID=1237068 RepID=A0A8H4L8P9_9HYPO|nr:Peptidase S33 tripeptidyl aminopeptidase-lik [Fusarium albosuccineum]
MTARADTQDQDSPVGFNASYPADRALLDEEDVVDSSQPADSACDANSMKALLKNGTRSFTETFNLPHFNDEMGDTDPSQVLRGNPAQFDLLGLTDDANQIQDEFAPCQGLEFLINSLTDSWASPFGNMHPFINDCGEWDLDWLSGANAQNLFQQPPLAQENKAATPQITIVRELMLRKVQDLSRDSSASRQLSAIIARLFCPSKIDAFVDLFFVNWHPNCPILHPPSFDVELVASELLISVVSFGAMYSHDKEDRKAARKILDIAELVIFSAEIFAIHNAMMYPSNEPTTANANEMHSYQFQQVQAGYLITTVQYWAGTQQAKSRAMETRFSDIVKIVRKFELTQVRHLPQDRISEELWIRKETQVRTTAMIRLLDCAFLFYSNYPCRLGFTELGSDLPCDNSVFNTKHPFAEENFSFRRGSTTADAFEELFRGQSDSSSAQQQYDAASYTNHAAEHVGGTYTILDLFLTIHLLYVFIRTNMSLLRPLYAAIGQGRPNSTFDQPPWVNSGDQVTAATQHALKRWRSMWLKVRADTPQDVWRATGMYRNAYSFWLVGHLLTEKSEALDLVRKIKIKCEDLPKSLEQLL